MKQGIVYIDISPQLVAAALRTGNRINVEVLDGLPELASITGAFYDFDRRVIRLRVIVPDAFARKHDYGTFTPAIKAIETKR